MSHASKTRCIAVFALVAVLLALVGCAGPSYVNIPPERGDVALHGSNRRTVRAVVIASVKAIITDTPLEGTVALSLPEGAEAITYASVTNAVGSNVVPFNADDEGLEGAASIKITGIRVRAHTAEIDAVRAKAGGAEQLVTVYMKWDLVVGDWHVDRIRPWRIPLPQQEI